MANVKLRLKQENKTKLIFKIFDKTKLEHKKYEFYVKPNGTQNEVPVTDYLAEILLQNELLEVA